MLDKKVKRTEEYRYLYFFMMLFITIFIVCDTTAFRMTMFFGTAVPTSGMIIPIVFALGDLISEVYGYSISRKLIWNNLVCQFIFGILITLALKFPSPPGNNFNLHYHLAFQHIIRTNITSCLSVTSGMFANAFLMSKFKIWMNGKRFWARTIISSSMSEFVLCFVAYSTLYVGLKNVYEIWKIVIVVWYYKLLFSICAAPFVTIFSNFIKKLEKSDVYDYQVKYNPFTYHTIDNDIKEI